MPRILLRNEAPPGAELRLHTRKQRQIPNERPLPLPPAQVRANNDSLSKAHPDWRLRSTDSTYNCLGMVFASRRTMIDPEWFELIISDDGYRRLEPGELRFPGDLVVYRSSEEVVHVGMVIHVGLSSGERMGLHVLSKFGWIGEYLHPVEELPIQLLGVSRPSVELWTDRIAG